ncbi:MAG TPA: hypothetical protein VFQ65_11620 [Kofleriaceae bacterium]|nr:hypothetical protein [Kofleriaceae bacterium]
MAFKLSLLIVATGAVTASAQPGIVDPLAPESPVEEPVLVRHVRPDPLATTEPWGGGLRLTGASGIGALPGRNFGAEVAVNVRHDELFAELALSHWQPENEYRVMSAGTPVPLGLDVWAMRAGWSSMRMPLRAWLLAEVGEVAGTNEMSGVLPRMVMGDTPAGRRWTAVGAGVGVAWPLSNQIRLVGSMELAVPITDEHLVIDNGIGDYKPDPLAARYAVGLEVGWR